MRIAVIGTGALGGLYGGRLAAAGHEVHFLARGDRAHLRQHGLRVDSIDGDLVLPQVRVSATSADIGPCDLVLITLKATQNPALAELLPPLCAEHSVVLLLQNGIGGEEQIRPWCGPAGLAGGLAFVCATKEAPGHVVHTDYGRVVIGAHRDDAGAPLCDEARLRRIAAAWEEAGTETSVTDHLARVRWQKLVWNVPYNGLSVVLRCDTAPMTREPLASLVRTLMREVQAGAAACGCRIEDEHIERMIGNTERMTPYKTSMLVDYERGRPLEVEALFGNPLRLARLADHELELRSMAMLYAQVKYIDSQLSG